MKSTRVTSRRESVENAVDLMYRAVAKLERGQSYDDLLRARTQPARVDPRVFISAGSIVLWAGGRPRFFGRLLRRGRLRLDVRTFNALVWTIWAFISPGSLRAFLSMLLRTRNRLAARAVFHNAPLRWTPPINRVEG